MTDFRGSGLLGLQSLWSFVTQDTEQARRCYQVSRVKATEYFFACSSINITFNVLSRLREYDFYDLFNSNVSEEDARETFYQMYVRVFVDFHDYFARHARASDLMSFQYIMVVGGSHRTSTSTCWSPLLS